jgi:plasmid stability protein
MAKAQEHTHQVATRVSTETREILTAGLLTERAESMQELLRPVVEAYAEKLEKEPEVKTILAEIDKYQSRKHGIRKLKQRKPGAKARSRSNPSG